MAKILSSPRIRKMTSSFTQPSSFLEVPHRSFTPQKRETSLQTALTTKSSLKIKTLQEKAQFQISSEHLVFLMEEQRSKDLLKIQSEVAVNKYYNCLNSLFMIVWQIGQAIAKDPISIRLELLRSSNVKLIKLLFDKFSLNDGDILLRQNLRNLSNNINRVARSSVQFEKRVEYISRKLCINLQKKDKINRAFINSNVSKFWDTLCERAIQSDLIDVVEDMFEHPSQRLCLLDFSRFLNMRMCSFQFGKKLCKFGRKQEIDEDLNYDFTVQFLVMQDFIQIQSQESPIHEDSTQKGCMIM